MMPKTRSFVYSLFFFAFCALAVPSHALAALININTADAALLDTLPGIGPTKATAIIDYRKAHGPFAKIEDIQNVSGIGASTYAEIAPLITVGDTPVQQTLDTSTPTTTQTATTNQNTATASHGTSSRPPSPPALMLEIIGDDHAYPNVPLELTLRVRTPKGDDDTFATFSWGFGDGSEGAGKTIRKSYAFPGSYLVTAYSRHGDTVGKATLLVHVALATARITSATADGVTIQNDSPDTLDVSEWVIRTADNSSFRIPEHTTLAPKSAVLFPNSITRLFATGHAELYYTDGGLVAAYPEPSAAEKPVATDTGLQERQATSPAPIISPSRASHAIEPVIAPAGAASAAPAGASTSGALPVVGASMGSPWIVGFLGVVMVAGAALLIL